MRENIGLFRGKRIDNGEWIEGSFLRDGEKHKPINRPDLQFSDCYIVPKTDLDIVRLVGTNAIGLNIWAHHIDPETVGECTGLMDKNGKLIFEGDILEGYDFDAEDGFGVVEWYDGAFEVGNGQWYGSFHENYNGANFEIIGNIHDNGELLKGGADNG